MIIDVTEIVLIPGNLGKDCPGNGEWPEIECCCEECDYMLCCVDSDWYIRCGDCKDLDCPRIHPDGW